MQLIDAGIDLHSLRDPTRGGLATTLVEIAQAVHVDFDVYEAPFAVSEPVRGACEILGLDPLYVASEGRFVAFVAPRAAEDGLAILRRAPDGGNTAIIRRVDASRGRGVVRNGLIGDKRVLDKQSGEQCHGSVEPFRRHGISRCYEADIPETIAASR